MGGWFAIIASIVKSHSGKFVQWSDTGDVHSECLGHKASGPDVLLDHNPQAAPGSFGLTHEQLLQSEWVQNDTLTLEFMLEVRPMYAAFACAAVEVPQSTIKRDVKTLLENGMLKDVLFIAFSTICPFLGTFFTTLMQPIFAARAAWFRHISRLPPSLKPRFGQQALVSQPALQTCLTLCGFRNYLLPSGLNS